MGMSGDIFENVITAVADVMQETEMLHLCWIRADFPMTLGYETKK